MKKCHLFVCLIAFQTFLVRQAFAENNFFGDTGNTYFNQCIEAKQQFTKTMCMTYVAGLGAGASSFAALILRAAGSDYPNVQWGFCAPEGVSIGQLFDVLNNYIIKHPEERHLKLQLLAPIAWAEAWPCTNEPKLVLADKCPKPR